MKMKLTALLFFVATAGILLFVHIGILLLLLPLAFAVVFGLYGVAKSVRIHVNRFNDAPNALRVFLASLGGALVTLYHTFLFPSAGVLLLFASFFLNDEYQRRALRALRTGKRGGSVALLGIDGSGKSSHSVVTSAWLKGRGYRIKLMPFHTYLFVERLASLSAGGKSSTVQLRRRRNPLRPLASLVDNMILQITSSIGCRLEGTVVIYDRFIWSTFIKYEALGYPVGPLARLYLSPRPYFAIVLDVPVEKSLKVIDERVAHIHYPGSVLQHERDRYLGVARRYGYPVVDATGSFEEVQARIEALLGPLFPASPSGGGAAG